MHSATISHLAGETFVTTSIVKYGLIPCAPFHQRLLSLFTALSSIEFPTIVVLTFPFMPSSNLFATSIQCPLNLTSPGNFQFPTTSILACELSLLNSSRKPSDATLKTGDSATYVHHAPTGLKTRKSSSSVSSILWMEMIHSSGFRDVKLSLYPSLSMTILMGRQFLVIQVNQWIIVKPARGYILQMTW